MSATVPPPVEAADPHDGADGHGHDHGPFFAHHFESWKQQFDAGKLGIWAFLVQEVLFFSGLFCAYTIYRTLHPEVFDYADQFLSVPHGAFNTLVLLFSSLTMAWGVRCAMLGQRTGLIVCLAVTLGCAALFLGVKAYEYTEKYHAQLIWAGADPLTVQIGATHDTLIHLDEKNRAQGEVLEERLEGTLRTIQLIVGLAGLLFLAAGVGIWYGAKHFVGTAVTLGCVGLVGVSMAAGAEASLLIHHLVHGVHVNSDHTATGVTDAEHGITEAITAEQALQPPPAGQGASPATSQIAQQANPETPVQEEVGEDPRRAAPDRLSTFFSIYYAMTGVHALHILGGMVVLTWLLVRSVKGHFTPEYFGPVDYVGLYWHLVDLVWIYLFPLLYLIG